LGSDRVNCLAVSGNIVFAGTSGGIFISADNGTSWTAYSFGPTDVSFLSFAVSGGNLFAGTPHGVWLRPVSEILSSADAYRRREILSHPPFKISPSCRDASIVAVEFTVPHSDRVAIALYDPAGREVVSLINKPLDAGAYRYFWDTHRLAQGCYAVRLQVGSTAWGKTIRIVR
jgi:hypothetical protein